MRDKKSFLILSGGVGSRSRHFEPKQFYKINGIEMIAYSLRIANEHPAIGEIVTNAPEGFEERTQVLCDKYAPDKPAKILPCGMTRQESVRILCKEARSRSIILHEAARPMLTADMIDELIAADAKNAGLYVAVSYSMCSLDGGFVSQNVPRENIFNIQLPQKFDRDTLLRAHDAAVEQSREFTEDSVLLKEMTGEAVRAVAGHPLNIKVTTPEDFGLATKLLS